MLLLLCILSFMTMAKRLYSKSPTDGVDAEMHLPEREIVDISEKSSHKGFPSMQINYTR